MATREFLFDWEILETDELVTSAGDKIESTLSRVYLDDRNLGGKSAKRFMPGPAHYLESQLSVANGSQSANNLSQSASNLPSHFNETAISGLSISTAVSSPGPAPAKMDCGDGDGGCGEDKGGGDDKKQAVPLDYDFSYQPERDAHLLARDANKLFSKDRIIMKHFAERRRLFSKIDNAILMDREGWYSVSPERIAEHIADRMVPRAGCVILDGFAGVGGNAIQLALRGAHVIAVDVDPLKLRCAAQNARVYGVRNRIDFVCGDFFNVVESLVGLRRKSEQPSPRKVPEADEKAGEQQPEKPAKDEQQLEKPAKDGQPLEKSAATEGEQSQGKPAATEDEQSPDKPAAESPPKSPPRSLASTPHRASLSDDGITEALDICKHEDEGGEGDDAAPLNGRIDAIFLSPPWGGPSYQKAKTFDVERGMTPGASKALEAARKLSPNICLFAPKNASAYQLISLAGPGKRAEVEQTMLNGQVKTKTAYYGDLVGSV